MDVHFPPVRARDESTSARCPRGKPISYTTRRRAEGNSQ